MSYEDIQRQVDDTKKEIDTIKTEVDGIKTTVSNINLHVTNHLPHQIAEQNEMLKKLEARLTPVETKYTKIIGVSEFLTLVLKATTAIAAVTWTVLQIIKSFHS